MEAYLENCDNFSGCGILFTLLGLAFGANTKGVNIGSAGIWLILGKEGKITELDLESFKNIEISALSANVDFKNADQYGIDISSYEGEVNWSVQEGSLKISQQQSDGITLLSLSPDTNNKETNITIYLPKNAKLEDVSVKLNDGNLSIDGADAKSLYFICTFGNIDLNKTMAENIAIEMMGGVFTGVDLTAGTLQYKNKFGTGIFDQIATQTFNAQSDDGNIEIRESNMEDITVNSQFGNITTEALSSLKADFHTLKGTMNLRGDFWGESVIGSELGDISFATTKEKEDYTYSISTCLGELYFEN